MKSDTTHICFSVIIPVYNEAAVVGSCIESVRVNFTREIPGEIIVVDNGSKDGTEKIVKDMHVRFIENSSGQRKPIGVLRNIGAKESSGSILAFLDADMLVPPHWLKKAKEYFDEGFKGALGFAEDVPESAGWVGKTWGKALHMRRQTAQSVDFLTGRNFFINRSVFDEVRGFSETLITAEDKDLTFRVIRAGYKALSVPDIAVIHLGYEKNLGEFIRKEYWRQGYSLDLAREWGYTWRSLRNPLLSFWHSAAFFAFVFSLFFAHSFCVILFFICIWIFPSLLLTFKHARSREFYRRMLPLFFLTFIRWNVSGIALVKQVARRADK